jgi:hypothetical protein
MHNLQSPHTLCALSVLQQPPQDPDLRDAAGMLQQALNAETVQEEERLWTEVRTALQGPVKHTAAHGHMRACTKVGGGQHPGAEHTIQSSRG